MSKFTILSAILAVALFGTTDALKCNEGFNVSFGGVPFYHWSERTCTGDSKCFSQELSEKVVVDVAMSYGACVSAAYADLLDCNKLFGPDSTFDPAQLLDLVPDIEKRINSLVQDFVSGGLTEIMNVFTADGTSTESFIAGIIKFHENLGLNMEKVKPLQPSLTKLFRALFVRDPNALNAAVAEFITALGKLDTDSAEFTADMYNFLGNFLQPSQLESLKNDVNVNTLIEKMPGLGRSIFPASWEPEKWYDLTFKILGELDIKNPKQTTTNMITVIKDTFTIPDEAKQILDPFFDAFPDLIDHLAKGESTYAGTWSLELLKEYSERTDATKKFDAALINFIENVTTTGNQSLALAEEIKTMIRWLPGLFYKFAPSDRDAISQVFIKMANGFNSFNWADISDTSPSTKLSVFVFKVIEKTTGQQFNGTGQAAMIINFSYMFYDLMSDYTDQMDKMFTILINGFESWPNINPGKMISDTIVELGATVPPEVKPLLENLQGVLTAAMAKPFDTENLFTSFKNITDAYKTAFPDSPFPELVQRYINLIKDQVFFDYTQPNSMQEYNRLQLEQVYWQIDFQFALYNSMDYSSNEYTQMLIKAFPQYEVYIKVMQAAKPEDIKDLIKGVVAWASIGNLTTESFVSAMKPTFEKITASLTNVMKDLRALFQPQSCKFGTCDSDLCNTHVYIKNQDSLTKATTTTTKAPITTTSGSPTFSYSFLLNIATMWLACKALMG